MPLIIKIHKFYILSHLLFHQFCLSRLLESWVEASWPFLSKCFVMYFLSKIRYFLMNCQQQEV